MKVFVSKGTRFQMFNNLINVMKWASLFLILVLVSIASASEGEDAQYLQMRRTACLVLSRVHSNSQKEVIEQTIQALQPTDQNKYIGKLYAVAVLKCEESITQSEVQEVRHHSHSSTSKTPTSIPLITSTSSKASTTLRSPATSRPTESRKPSSSSPRSTTSRWRSERRSRRPRRKRRPELMRGTR
jgi:hypothetical protein